MILIFNSCSNSNYESEIFNRNSFEINSIDPNSDNQIDFSPLENILNDTVQIVLLGEQQHGDAPSLLAKTRIIKFLHEKLGYNVLAFESPLYDCYRAWEDIKSEEDCSNALSNSILPAWSNSKEFEFLSQYICDQAKTENPLRIIGFDSKFTSYSAQNIFNSLDSIISISDCEINYNERREFRKFIFSFSNNFNRKIDSSNVTKFHNAFNKIIQCLENNYDEFDFWIHILKGIKYDVEQNQFVDFTKEINYSDSIIIKRDKLMAENVIWLKDKFFKNDKIIINSANFHITRNPQLLKYKDSDYKYPINSRMGDFLYSTFKNKIYAIYFTAFEGSIYDNTFVNSFKIDKSSEGSLEYYLENTGYDFCFLNLRSNDKQLSTLLNKEIIFRSDSRYEVTANPESIADGVFFIKRMEPYEVKSK